MAYTPCLLYQSNSNDSYVQNTEFVHVMLQKRILNTCVPRMMQNDRISSKNTVFIAYTPCFGFRCNTNDIYVHNTAFVRLMHQTCIVHTCEPKTMPNDRISSRNTVSMAYTPCFMIPGYTNDLYVQNTKYVPLMHQTRFVHTCVPKSM